MELFTQQIYNILVTSPGSLAYHLVLAFSVAGAFQIVISAWRREGLPHAPRWLLGLGLLLALQLVQFVLAAAVWQNQLLSPAMLPPIDRGVSLLSLLLIAWLWLCARPSRLADAATILVGLLLLTLTVFGSLWWKNQDPTLTFNDTWLDFGSQLLAAGLAILSALLLLVRRPQGWGFGLGMMILFFSGHLLQVLLLPPGDFAGITRLFQVAAYPLLLLLPQVTAAAETKTAASAEESRAQAAAPSRSQTLELALIQEFSRLLVDPDPALIGQKITRSVCQVMLADFCLLVTPPNANNQMTVSTVYTLIQERFLDGFILDGNVSPMITNSMKRGRPVRITSANDSPEAYGLARGLGIKRLGNLMHVPIGGRGGPAQLGITVLTPYSNRPWTTDDQLALSHAAEILAPILQQVQVNQESKAELSRLQEAVEETQRLANESRQEASEQQAQVVELRQKMIEAQGRAESLAELVASQDLRLPLVQQLAEPLPAEPTVSLEDYKRLEQELQTSLQESNSLKELLARTEQETLSARSAQPEIPAPTAEMEIIPPSEQAEVVTSIAQELRQPMSSIVGYTDLLLGESIGILGAMQRKFLERVRASVERMGGLVDDLIHTVTVQSSEMELSPELVDLNTIIDDAVASSIARMREKKIILRMDLPERLPLIHADRDALQQIVLHLLENASAVSPLEGEILLHAHIERKENQPGFVLLQVSDSGGGIPPEELPRVFSRLYRADNPLIQGVGDTGVGLSSVKALVEAHGGRVWVDSVVGVGSTFSVLLPAPDGLLDNEAGGF